MPARTTPQPLATVRVFTQRFSSTRLGARLARHLSLHQLDAWGVPYGSATSETAELIVAELVANAAVHGRVPGRDFELKLSLTPAVMRMDVSDTRGERRPPAPGGLAAPADTETAGRGLLLVDALADRWSVIDRMPVGKTVRAEIDLAVGKATPLPADRGIALHRTG